MLKDLNLELPANGWVALVGRSGSGKTTLLQLLGGLDRPTSGKILYRSQDLGKLSKTRLTQLRRSEFGFVFQSYHLLPERLLKTNGVNWERFQKLIPEVPTYE